MEALTIFKQAGLEEILNGVKNEWDNGHFLKPMAVGAGVGGLGFGGSALLDNKKDETGGAKAKRVLTQLLKGTALGAGAGGAYGGLSYAFGKDGPKDGPKSDSAPKETPKAGPKGEGTSTSSPTQPSQTGNSPSSEQALTRWERFGKGNRENVSNPLTNAGAGAVGGAAIGGGAGAGLGYLGDLVRMPKPSLDSNPAYTLGKTVTDYTKPDGLLSKALSEAASEASKGKPLSFLDSAGNPAMSGGRVATMHDVVSRLNPTTLPEGPTGEILGQLRRMMDADKTRFAPNNVADTLSSVSRFGHQPVLPPGLPDDSLLEGLRKGMASNSHLDLPSIKAMAGLEQAANRSHMLRGGLAGLKGGGILGALGGAGASIASQLAFPKAPLNVPNTGAAGVQPDMFK